MDNGYGILLEYLVKIFDFFFIIKLVGVGIGLGLFIVFGIVEKY